MRLITYWRDLRMRRVVVRLLGYARQSAGGMHCCQSGLAERLHELQLWRLDEVKGTPRPVVLIYRSR